MTQNPDPTSLGVAARGVTALAAAERLAPPPAGHRSPRTSPCARIGAWQVHPMGLARRTVDGERLEWRRIRRRWVLRDAQAARLLGMETRALNQWIQRRADLFPEPFSFQLEPEEWLRSFADADAQNLRPRPPRVLTSAGLLQARLLREGASQISLVRWLATALPLLEAVGPVPEPWIVPPPPPC